VERGFHRFKGFPIEVGQQTYAHLSSLSPLQQRILALLNFPVKIYTQLGLESDEPP
jgi:hypothetical protein